MKKWTLAMVASACIECAHPPRTTRPPDSYYQSFRSEYTAYSRDWEKPLNFREGKISDSITFFDSTISKEITVVYVDGQLQGEKEAPGDCPPGQRPTAEILKVIGRETPRGIRKVYNKFLYRNPSLGGKVTVKFHIMKNGTVFSVVPIGDTTGDPQFVNAVASEILGWRFPETTCDNYDIVTVPFTVAP